MIQRRLLPNTPALLAFDAVAREGSFSRAAEMLGVTQPALTKAMHRLEDEAGVTLFDRRSRGVSTGGSRICAEPSASSRSRAVCSDGVGPTAGGSRSSATPTRARPR